MSVKIIDTLKPKNNGSFPIVEAVDVAVTSELRLPEALEAKADASALADTNAVVETKANASDVSTATANLQGQINQIEISATAEAVVAPEVAGARVGADGTSYQTLKARLDAERNGVKGDISAIIDMIDMKSNMYNKDDARNKSGGYYTSAGTYSSATGYHVSHPIEVVSGIEYKATFPSTDLGNNPAIIYVNEEGTIQSYFNGTINGGIITFTPPHSGLISINLGKQKNSAVLSKSEDYAAGLTFFSLNDLPSIIDGLYTFAIDLVNTHSNLFNKDDTRNKSGGYYTKAGAYQATANYWVSHPIDVIAGLTYKASHAASYLGDNNVVVYVDSNGDIVSHFLGTINDGVLEFTAPEDGTISVNLGLTSAKNATVVARSDDYQEGLPYFSIHDLPDMIEDINGSIDDINDQLDSLGSACISKSHVISANLYNNADYVAGKYISDNGDIASAAGYAYTGVIELEAGSYVTLEYKSDYGGNAIHYFVCDSEGTIQSVKNFTELQQEGNIRIATFTLSQKSYIRLNSMANSVESLMVCYGDSISDYPDTFIPYSSYDKVEENIHLSDTMKSDVAQIAAGNQLTGKMISVEGDSICWGNGYRGGYAKIIADDNNMQYENGAVGGATIVSGTYISDSETPRHWVCRSISAMSSSADYIIIEGGVNDASLQVELGEITGTYNAALDDTTFYGAIESIFKQVVSKFKEKKYCFLIPHQMTYGMTPKGNYYKAIYECAEKWGMPICDLSTAIPPFGLFAANSDLREELTDVYTTAGDGWHPTEQCYRKYYVDKIVSFLKSL